MKHLFQERILEREQVTFPATLYSQWSDILSCLLAVVSDSIYRNGGRLTIYATYCNSKTALKRVSWNTRY